MLRLILMGIAVSILLTLVANLLVFAVALLLIAVYLLVWEIALRLIARSDD